MCPFKINEIQTVKLVVNYVVLVKSVKNANHAISGNFFYAKPGWHEIFFIPPCLYDYQAQYNWYRAVGVCTMHKYFDYTPVPGLINPSNIGQHAH